MKSLQLQKLSHKDLLLLFILGLLCEVDTKKFVHEAQTYPNAGKIRVLPHDMQTSIMHKKYFFRATRFENCWKNLNWWWIATENILPNDVIYIARHSNPVVTHKSGISFVHLQWCVVKPIVLVSFEEVREAICVTKNAVYGGRDALPMVVDRSRITWIDTRKILIVTVVVWSEEEINIAVWPAECSIDFARSLRMSKIKFCK